MSDSKWVGPVYGKDLSTDTIARLPNEAGVYIWRKSIRLDPDVVLKSDKFKTWLSSCLEVPYLSAKSLRITPDKNVKEQTIRSDFVAMENLVIGSGSYAKNKVDKFVDELADITARQDIYGIFWEAGVIFSPVLYVGETESLRSRIGDHFTGKTKLLKRLNELGLDKIDTCIHYLILKDKNKRERENIEYFLTHLLFAPLTIRAG